MKRTLITSLLVTSMLVAPAIMTEQAMAATPAAKSESTMKSESTAKADIDYDRLMKLSDDGFKAMRDVRFARLAIFSGHPDDALKNVKDASIALDKTKVDAKKFYGRSNATGGSQEWVPVDASVDIADSFFPTAEKQKHIAKANEQFKAGNKQKAVEELKLADIDVNYTRIMMPLKTTQKHVKTAESLLDSKKYYEANLALKAAQDGLVIDTTALVDVPKPGDKSNKTASAVPAAKAPAENTGASK
jgi:hypothetical protein